MTGGGGLVTDADAVDVPVSPGFGRAEVEADRPVDDTLPVLVLLRESATACGLRLGRICGLPLRLEWVDSWRAPAETAQRTAAWWWPFGMGAVSAAVGLTNEAVAFLADVFLGGDGSSVTAHTPCGDFEIAILSRHLGACFQPLEFLETPGIADTGTSMVGLQTPAATALPAALAVSDALMIRLAVHDPAGHHGDALLMLPARTILGGAGPTAAPRRQQASREGEGAARGTARDAMSDAVHDVPVTVRFRLPAVALSALDVAHLEPGDVVRLARSTTVDGYLADSGAAGARVLSGVLGQRAGDLAVQVHAVMLEQQ